MEREEQETLLRTIFENEQLLLQDVSKYLFEEIKWSTDPLPKELWTYLKCKIELNNDVSNICEFLLILKNRSKKLINYNPDDEHPLKIDNQLNEIRYISEIDRLFICSFNVFKNVILKFIKNRNKMKTEWMLKKISILNYQHIDFEIEKMLHKFYFILARCNIDVLCSKTRSFLLDTLFSIYEENILNMSQFYLAIFSISEETLFQFCLREAEHVSNKISTYPEKLFKNEPFYSKDNLNYMLKHSVINGLCRSYLFFNVLLKAHKKYNWSEKITQDLGWNYPFHLLLYVHWWTNSENKLNLRHIFEEALKYYIKSEPFVCEIPIRVEGKGDNIREEEDYMNKEPSFNINLLMSLVEKHATVVISDVTVPLEIPYRWFLEILDDCSNYTSDNLLLEDSESRCMSIDLVNKVSLQRKSEKLELKDNNCFILEYGKMQEISEDNEARSSPRKAIQNDNYVNSKSENKKLCEFDVHKISEMIEVKINKPSLENLRKSWICTYQGYSVLLFAYQIIHIGKEMDQIITEWNDRNIISEDDMDACNSFYGNNVSELWNNVKHILNEISLIGYKLKVMEILFSMLFTKYTNCTVECKGDYWLNSKIRNSLQYSGSKYWQLGSYYGSTNWQVGTFDDKGFPRRKINSESNESEPYFSVALLINTKIGCSSSKGKEFSWYSYNINTLVAWDLLIILTDSLSLLEISLSQSDLTLEDKKFKEDLIFRMRSILCTNIALPLKKKLNKAIDVDVVRMCPKLILLDVVLKSSDLSIEIASKVFDFVISWESIMPLSAVSNSDIFEKFTHILNKVKFTRREIISEENKISSLKENTSDNHVNELKDSNEMNFHDLKKSWPKPLFTFTNDRFAQVESNFCTKPFLTSTESITHLNTLLPKINSLSSLLESIFPCNIDEFKSFESDLENLFCLSSSNNEIDLSESLRNKTISLINLIKPCEIYFNPVEIEARKYRYLSVLATFVKMLTTVGYRYLRLLPILDEYFYLLKERPVDVLRKFSFYLKTLPQFVNGFYEESEEQFSLICNYISSPFEDPLEKNILSVEENLSSFSLIHDDLDLATLSKLGCSYMDGYYVLNANKLVCVKPVCGDVAVKDLLFSLIKLLHDVSSEFGERFEISHKLLPLYFKNSEIRQLLLKCSELLSADLTKLVEKQDSLVFYINLANLMFLHAILLNCLIFKDSNGKVGLFAESKMEQIIAFKKIGYSVGQLGFVSLFDVIFKILKQPLVCDSCNLCNNSVLSFIGNEPAEEELENMLDIDNVIHPLLIFVVTRGMSPSPKICVFDALTFDEDLKKAVVEYLLNTIDPNVPSQFKNPILFTFLSTHPSGISNAVDSLKSIIENMDDHWQCSFLSQVETIDWPNLELNFSLNIIITDYCDGYNVIHEDESNIVDDISEIKISQPIYLSETSHSYLKNCCPMLMELLKNVNFLIKEDLARTKIVKERNENESLPKPDFQFYGSKSPTTICEIYYPRFKSKSKVKDSCLNESFECDFPFEYFYAIIIKSIENSISTIPLINLIAQNKNSVTNMLKICDLLTELPPFVVDSHYALSFICDRVMAYLAGVNSSTAVPEPWIYVNRIKNTSLRFDVVKKSYINWPLDINIQCLQLLIIERGLTASQSDFVDSKLKLLEVYLDIISIENFHFKTMRDVMTSSLKTPEVLLARFLREGYNSIALRWIEYHGYTEKFLLQYVKLSLIQILTEEDLDFRKAELILNHLKEEKLDCFMKEFSVIIEDHEVKKFLNSHFLKNNQSSDLELLRSVQQEQMGLILVEDVAPITANKSQLCSIVSRPDLIMEQWIMSLKLEWVDKGIQVLSSLLDSTICIGIEKDLEFNSEDVFKNVNCLCWKHFNLMIEHYAIKALDLSGSRCYMMINTSEEEEPPFVMPVRIPKQSEWQENSSVSICPVCKVSVFTMICRRHHCRRCGRVVCGDCSLNRFVVQGYGENPVRVCQMCFENMSDSSRSESTNELEDISDRASNDSMETGWYLTTDLFHNELVRKEFSYDYAPTVNACHALYVRHHDDNRAALCILKLCHKVFKAIVDSLESSEVDQQFLLKIIKTLISSAKLRFVKLGNVEGITACEYNNQWVLRLQRLINFECISLIPSGTLANMLRISESRITRLSKDKAQNIHKELDQERKFLRVLVNNLVANNVFEIALDISTKEGFEQKGIWVASAIYSLKSGDFKTSREIIAKILRPITDKNKDIKIPLLEEIVSVLENPAYTIESNEAVSFQGFEESKRKSNATKTKNIKGLRKKETSRVKNIPENGKFIISALHKLECESYLKMYGSHRLYLQFQIRYSCFKDALIYSRDNNINERLFTSEIILPVYQKEKLDKLWTNLLDIDPDERWSSSIISRSCKYLDKRGNLHCLLDILKLLSDEVRAFWTLVRLYIQGAESYTELKKSKSYLSEAILHLQAYLDFDSIEDVKATEKVPTKLCQTRLHCDSTKVKFQLKLAEIQDKITEYLAELENSGQNFRYKIIIIHESICCKCKLGRKQDCKILFGRNSKTAFIEVPTVFNKYSVLALATLLLCIDENAATNLSWVHQLMELNSINPKELLASTIRARIRSADIQNKASQEFLSNQEEKIVRELSTKSRSDEKKILSSIIGEILQWSCIPDSEIKDVFVSAFFDDEKHLPQDIAELLMQYLTNWRDRMDLCIVVGQLRLAYSQVWKRNDAEQMERLMNIASEQNNIVVVDKCKKWLMKHKITEKRK